MLEVEGKSGWTAERIGKCLSTVRSVMENGVKGLSELMKLAADESIVTLLEKTLEPDGLAEIFPEDVLREGGLTSGLQGLRNDPERHWVQVFNWSDGTKNEIEETYNFLRLVRIPIMTLKILQEMGNKSIEELAALTKEQYQEYSRLQNLAFPVLENATEVLGNDYAVTFLKTTPNELQTCLRKFKPRGGACADAEIAL